ncbi:Transmembrane amino acid transporter protein [Tritrichomonas foetus]|uniref:Transmembrane amino acid transporter protein n=1 Tax=Tritrichomonas foetus TaxID=1144522 RepID=A0A1J4K6N9_9EUKA|nr:Transmembrane amino acid transporter protein [Tritrichomonas foetus]|eukprot:OHT07023.1 Transmembrane amino acid transporter protein [Tritrichomonas foetus]
MDMGNEQLLNPATGVASDYTVTLTSTNGEKESIFDIPVPGDSSMFGCFQILLNTAIGSGTLMVPYAYTAGVGTELLISSVFCFVAYMALYFLIEASQYTNTYDYYGIFRSCFGQKYMWFLNLSIFLVQYGTVTIYCLWNGRLLNHLVGSSNPILGSNAFWSFLIVATLVFPLIIFRSISHLESFASISTFFIVLLIVHALYWMIRDVNDFGFDPNHELKVFEFSRYQVIISALSVNSMAFNCHLNLFSCLEHLKNCTLKRAHQLCGLTVLVSFGLYNCFGLFSYFDLFDKIGAGSSLEFYPHPNIFTKITIVGVVVVLIVSSPLVVWAARIGFNNLIWKDKPVTPLRWVLIGGGLTLTAALLASSSEDVIFFFDIVGGFFTPTIEFVLPAIFFLKIQRGAPKWKVITASIVLFFSIVSIVACIYQAIKQIIEAATK